METRSRFYFPIVDLAFLILSAIFWFILSISLFFFSRFIAALDLITDFCMNMAFGHLDLVITASIRFLSVSFSMPISLFCSLVNKRFACERLLYALWFSCSLLLSFGAVGCDEAQSEEREFIIISLERFFFLNSSIDIAVS